MKLYICCVVIGTTTMIVTGLVLLYFCREREASSILRLQMTSSSCRCNSSLSISTVSCRRKLPLHSLPDRLYLLPFLESFEYEAGVELGVKIANFSDYVLSHWPSCKKYILVDIWRSTVEKKQARDRLSRYENRLQLVWLHNTTQDAAAYIADNSLDFVFIDAAHDYCSVMEDLYTYWPKLKSGGLFAGHDYVAPKNKQKYDCALERPKFTGVKHAVDEFVAQKRIADLVGVTLNNKVHNRPTFYLIKP